MNRFFGTIIFTAFTAIFFVSCKNETKDEPEQPTVTPATPTTTTKTLTWDSDYLINSIGAVFTAPTDKGEGVVTLSYYGEATTLTSVSALYMMAVSSSSYFTFTCEKGNFTCIEMATPEKNQSLKGEGWARTDSTAVWTGDAKTVTISSCQIYVSKIVFTYK